MKINMPVANEEYVLLENDSLVSQTDLSGLITFVNADFIRVSGYSEQELIGGRVAPRPPPLRLSQNRT